MESCSYLARLFSCLESPDLTCHSSSPVLVPTKSFLKTSAASNHLVETKVSSYYASLQNQTKASFVLREE